MSFLCSKYWCPNAKSPPPCSAPIHFIAAVYWTCHCRPLTINCIPRCAWPLPAWRRDFQNRGLCTQWEQTTAVYQYSIFGNRSRHIFVRLCWRLLISGHRREMLLLYKSWKEAPRPVCRIRVVPHRFINYAGLKRHLELKSIGKCENENISHISNYFIVLSYYINSRFSKIVRSLNHKNNRISLFYLYVLIKRILLVHICWYTSAWWTLQSARKECQNVIRKQ